MHALKQSRIDRFFILKIPSNLFTNGARRTLTSILILNILDTSLTHHQMRAYLIYHSRLTIIAYFTLFILVTLLRGIIRLLLFLFWLYCVVSLTHGVWAKFTITFYSFLVELFTDIAVVIFNFCFTMRACISCCKKRFNLLEI